MAGEAARDEVEPTVVQQLTFGAIAGVIPRFILYPLETLKSRAQVQGAIPKSYAKHTSAAISIRETYLTKGLWRGFYPGVYVALVCTQMGSIPGSATYFMGYELGKKVFHSEWMQKSLPLGLNQAKGTEGAICGLSAQLLANLVFTPVDITKERMQVQLALGKQQSTMQLVSGMMKSEGVSSLMRGYWKGNLLWLPWSMVYISSYETLKEALVDQSGQQFGKLNDTLKLGFCAASSTAVACLVTHPIDVLKTRIQALPSAVLNQSESFQSQTTISMARSILRTEGIRGLGSGLGLRVLQLAPAQVITWLIYEYLKENFV